MVHEDTLLRGILNRVSAIPPDLCGNLTVTLGPHRVQDRLVVVWIAPAVQPDPSFTCAVSVICQLRKELLSTIVRWKC